MNQDELLLQSQRFDVVRRTRTLADGADYSREVILHPGAVTIIPFLTSDQLILIRNFRFAVDDVLLELPAGTLEPEEAPLETARRELLEETGFQSRSIEFVHAFWMSPGILRERMHLFLARDLTPGAMELDAGEQIEPTIVSMRDALELIRTGQIQDAKTLVGLLWYDRWLRQTSGDA